MTYAEIFETLPPELRLPIARLTDALKAELGVRSSDFEDLKSIVRDLATAQKQTETRLAELVEAQKELAVAQTRTENEFARFRQTFAAQIGGLGARWGLQTEAAFRHGMRTILEEAGFTTERFVAYDTAGEVFGQPDQVELDVVVRDGKVILVEIKSALDRGHVHLFNRKVQYYSRQTGRAVDRKLIVTPYADERAQELALALGVEICTDVTALQESSPARQ